jgi:uncharacterized protein YhfF
MIDPAELRSFWEACRAARPGLSLPAEPPLADCFCDNEPCANELGDLVRRGIKTATCSLLWSYEAEGDPLPQPGDLSIVTDWTGRPLCVIEITEVSVRPYNEVDAQFAYDEGEGDRSLAYWRQAHWDFFSRECAQIGREPAEDMPLVCERFRLLYTPA